MARSKLSVSLNSGQVCHVITACEELDQSADINVTRERRVTCIKLYTKLRSQFTGLSQSEDIVGSHGL